MVCRPWWVTKFIPYEKGAFIQKPGCGTILNTEDPNYGWNLCPPEALRAYAESVMQASGLWSGPLSIDTYSLARNIASEQGNGTLENKVALALSTMGRARLRGQTVTQVVLTNALGRPLYGRIMAADGVSGASYKRWTASSADPRAVDVLIAAFALSGGAGKAGDPSNFALGADDQSTAAATNVYGGAQTRNYWVGPVPNVNPWEQFLMRHMPEVAPDSTRGKALLQRGLAVQASQPDASWQASGICAKPLFVDPFTGAVVILSTAVAAGGSFLLLKTIAAERRYRGPFWSRFRTA